MLIYCVHDDNKVCQGRARSSLYYSRAECLLLPLLGAKFGSPYTKHRNHPAIDLAKYVLDKEKPTMHAGGITCRLWSRGRQTPCSSRPPGRAGSEVAPVI